MKKMNQANTLFTVQTRGLMEKELCEECAITEFSLKLLKLIDESAVEYHEMGFAMVTLATHMLLDVAPNELLAIKTVMAGMELGIKEYQEGNQKDEY